MERPIIFSAPMVRALLDGHKTQTRRVLRDGFANDIAIDWSNMPAPGFYRTDCLGRKDFIPVKVPFATGDRLWVREVCKPIPDSKPGGYFVPGSPFHGVNWFYRADSNCPLWADGRWKPSIHMPRTASRITLTVTDVRVERLQGISEADAVAEGVDAVTMDDVPRQAAISRRSDFAALWNCLHGAAAWDANPWVVALTFTVARGNIDGANT